MSVVHPAVVVAAAALLLPVAYDPPVDAPVADGFRPPATPYGPGNRGLAYSLPAGTPVRATAPGVVAFAGPVGGSHAVSIVHPDGLRTTYSFLEAVDVRPGDRVRAGQAIGRAGERFHLGAVAGGAYLDPRHLFESQRPGRRARLVRDDGSPTTLHPRSGTRRATRTRTTTCTDPDSPTVAACGRRAHPGRRQPRGATEQWLSSP